MKKPLSYFRGLLCKMTIQTHQIRDMRLTHN